MTGEYPVAHSGEQTKPPKTANALLVIGTAVYLFLNGFGVALTMEGVIWPPWNLLSFFTICPLVLIVLVSILRVFVRMNLAVLIGFAIIMVLAAAFNLMILGEAMASV